MTNRTPPIESTPRLALREFNRDDVDDVHVLDSDPLVMRFIGDGSVSTREDAHAAIERTLARYVDTPGLGVWHVARRDDHVFIGWVSLKHAGASPDIEIGYRLRPIGWGQGFATELARAMLVRGFDRLRLDRIIGVTHPDNLASQRVLLKAGLRDEGWGHYYDRDLRRFALDRTRWREAAMR